MDTDSLIRLFDNWADSYDADVVAARWGFEHYSDALKWICRQLVSNLRSDRVIDLGCGTGILAEQLQKVQPSIEYIGIDISPKMLKIASKKCPTVSFIQADMRECRTWAKYLEPERFCTVVSAYALHHINDTEKIRLIKYLFTASKHLDFRFVIVDYAFLNIYERKYILREQRSIGNLHVTEEIESEYYADLSVLRNALSQYNIDLSLEKNGLWDWRILCEVNAGSTLGRTMRTLLKC
jgi:SAM-dependent methyltransferase